MSRSVVLAAGKRTEIGDFGGSLKDTPLSALGAHTVKATLATAGMPRASIILPSATLPRSITTATSSAARSHSTPGCRSSPGR